MIIEQFIENNTRVRHYSDRIKYILQNETNIKYEDAVDTIPCKYTYTETNEDIQTEQEVR